MFECTIDNIRHHRDVITEERFHQKNTIQEEFMIFFLQFNIHNQIWCWVLFLHQWKENERMRRRKRRRRRSTLRCWANICLSCVAWSIGLLDVIESEVCDEVLLTSKEWTRRCPLDVLTLSRGDMIFGELECNVGTFDCWDKTFKSIGGGFVFFFEWRGETSELECECSLKESSLFWLCLLFDSLIGVVLALRTEVCPDSWVEWLSVLYKQMEDFDRPASRAVSWDGRGCFGLEETCCSSEQDQILVNFVKKNFCCCKNAIEPNKCTFLDVSSSSVTGFVTSDLFVLPCWENNDKFCFFLSFFELIDSVFRFSIDSTKKENAVDFKERYEQQKFKRIFSKKLQQKVHISERVSWMLQSFTRTELEGDICIENERSTHSKQGASSNTSNSL